MSANIYENKNYKLYFLVPIILLLISLYFIPKVQLDSSLKGGINVQLQTNSTIDIRTLTTMIDQNITGAQSSVSRSPGGLSVTIATNASIALADSDLLAIYGEYGNYSSYSLNATAIQSQMESGNSSSVLKQKLSAAQAGQKASLSRMSNLLSKELSTLAPFLNGTSMRYNSSDPSSMLTAAKNAYANASASYKSIIMSTLTRIIPFSSYSYNEVTPTLGAFFLGEMRDIIIWAFIFIAITVFIIFRSIIPSFSVVFGAVNDMLVALGAMGLLGIPLGVASIGGLLMLIGYSIDTDILVAIRVLKRSEGTAAERANQTVKTGLTMTLSAIISFSILLIVSYLAFIPTYFEISGVVLVGLIADLATTWLGNMTIVLWYKEHQLVHNK